MRNFIKNGQRDTIWQLHHNPWTRVTSRSWSKHNSKTYMKLAYTYQQGGNDDHDLSQQYCPLFTTIKAPQSALIHILGKRYPRYKKTSPIYSFLKICTTIVLNSTTIEVENLWSWSFGMLWNDYNPHGCGLKQDK